MKLPTHGRYDYVPITRRPVYDWPEGKRLAVFFCNNIEHFAFGAGLGADPSGSGGPQNQSNYAWRDYGNRVGLWYYLDLLDEFGLPGAHNVNSAVLEYCPDIVERIRGRGDEFIGHGRTNSERQDALWEEDEARLIAEATEVITRLAGKKPEGWLGPGLAESRATPYGSRPPARSPAIARGCRRASWRAPEVRRAAASPLRRPPRGDRQRCSARCSGPVVAARRVENRLRNRVPETHRRGFDVAAAP